MLWWRFARPNVSRSKDALSTASNRSLARASETIPGNPSFFWMERTMKWPVVFLRVLKEFHPGGVRMIFGCMRDKI
jgi:hypothetical protein